MIKDYSDYNDFELINYVFENNEDAKEIIYLKYMPVIQNFANKWYTQGQNLGIEKNDLIQEGMIGLTKAMERFKESKDTTFYTFALCCIESSMKDLITISNRQKHKILNESISLNLESEEGKDFQLIDILKVENNDPAYLITLKDEETRLKELLFKNLTSNEQEVFYLKYQGFTIKEIADKLNKDYKSIDNTMQRIKNKLNKLKEEE